MCYTDRTLDEIYRVRWAKVSWLKRVTCYKRPLDLRSYDPGKVEFYCLYYDWTGEKTNQYDDYVGFREYLIKFIREVLSEICALHT